MKIPFISQSTEELVDQLVIEEALTDQELAAITGGGYYGGYDDDCDDDYYYGDDCDY